MECVLKTKINLEEDADTVVASNDALLQISEMCRYVAHIDLQINEEQHKMNLLTEHRRKLVEVDIPEAMRSAGMKSFVLDDGKLVSVKDSVFPSYTDANKQAVFSWLRENNHASLIKRVVEVKFGKGEDEKANSLCNLLIENSFDDWQQKESIHAGTFKAFVNEQLENGVALPSEISIFNKSEAVIKESKK